MGSSRTTPGRHSDAQTSAVPNSKNTNEFGTGAGRPSAAPAQVVGVELVLQVVGVELALQVVGVEEVGQPISLPEVIIPTVPQGLSRGSDHKVS